MNKKFNILRKRFEFVIFVAVIICDILLLVGKTTEYLPARIITSVIGLFASFIMCIVNVKNTSVVRYIFYNIMLVSFTIFTIFTISLICSN